MSAAQQAAILAALDAALSSLKALQALLAACTCTPAPDPDTPPRWWQALGLDALDGGRD